MPNKKRTRKSYTPRRTLARQLADLEAQIASLKARAATQERFDAKAVKAERDRLGLSAKQYAALVDVAPLTIYSWERGKGAPRDAQLARWLAVKGIPRAKAYKKLKLEDTGSAREKFSGKAVRADRKRRGLSAKAYAKLVGVSMLTIYNWEKGKSVPRAEQLGLWLKVKGIKRENVGRQVG